MLGRDDETTLPSLDGLSGKKHRNARDQRIPARMDETHQQQSCVSPRRVSAHIRRIQILRDQKTVIRLSCLPNFLIGSSCQVLGPHGINVVPELAKLPY
jgi:hypothetical protein